MLLDGFLLVMLSLAVISDVMSRRIPNWIIIIGVVFALQYYYHLDGCSGLLFSLQGFLAGIMLLLIPYVVGGMGAGDVKLLGMVGALKGSIFVFSSFLGMALWGGFIAFLILMAKGRLKETCWRLGMGLFMVRMAGASINDYIGKSEANICYPYGLAIGLGVLTSYGGWW